MTMDRFWTKVNKIPHGCWRWTGAINGRGYGHIKIDGRMIPAHRVAYEMVLGPIPEGAEIDHLCRDRACVNPAHLEPVTSRENTRRGFGPAGINARKTHCKRGHLLDEANVALVNTGRGRLGRQCLACLGARRRAA